MVGVHQNANLSLIVHHHALRHLMRGALKTHFSLEIFNLAALSGNLGCKMANHMEGMVASI